MRKLPSVIALVAASVSASACAPTCARTCRKLLDCDLSTPGWGQQDCESACLEQENLYQTTWSDPELDEGWSELKTCIVDEECGALEDGACYDERFFVF